MAPRPTAEMVRKMAKASTRPMVPNSAAPTPCRIPLLSAQKLFGPGVRAIITASGKKSRASMGPQAVGCLSASEVKLSA
jgi:hypothetical protein